MKEKESFGKQFKELEKIVKDFENDNIDLETSIDKFEKALILAEDLKKKLKGVENKVEVIKTKFKDVLDT